MIVAGFGFRSGATPDSLRDALARTNGAPHALSTVEDKASAPAFAAFARTMCLPVIAVPPDALRNQPTVTVSAASLAHRGTPSLAEAAALAAAGPNARLTGVRVTSADRLATCALAQGDHP